MIVFVFLRIVLTFEDNVLTLFKISLSENSELIAFAESSKLMNAFNVFFASFNVFFTLVNSASASFKSEEFIFSNSNSTLVLLILNLSFIAFIIVFTTSSCDIISVSEISLNLKLSL